MGMTSWSNKDLEALCIPENHKIIFDGFEYWWLHKIHGNKWELHCIESFNNWKKPYSWLKEWLYRWGLELSERKIRASSMYLIKMEESLESTKQVMEISNNKRLKTKDKIKMIQELLPEEPIIFIANVLNISRQAVHRHL